MEDRRGAAEGGQVILAKIENYRCGERSANDWVWIPDDMSENELIGLVDRAVRSYLEAEETMKGSVAVADPGYSPPYERFPEKSVAEVKREFEIEKQKYLLHKKIIESSRKPFAAHLVTVSGNRIKLFHDAHLAIVAEASWGHNHGKTIIYGTSTPQRLKEGDEED